MIWLILAYVVSCIFTIGIQKLLFIFIDEDNYHPYEFFLFIAFVPIVGLLLSILILGIDLRIWKQFSFSKLAKSIYRPEKKKEAIVEYAPRLYHPPSNLDAYIERLRGTSNSVSEEED